MRSLDLSMDRSISCGIRNIFSPPRACALALVAGVGVRRCGGAGARWRVLAKAAALLAEGAVHGGAACALAVAELVGTAPSGWSTFDTERKMYAF